MARSFRRRCRTFGLAASILLLLDANASGATARVTGLEIPRFVSLANTPARMRVGPGYRYRIKWVYLKPNIPLEILAEYDNWRKVRDHVGATGWMHHSLLSGQRFAIVAPWEDGLVRLRSGSWPGADISAYLEPGLVASLAECVSRWCKIAISSSGLVGYINQSKLWGTYPGETVR